MKSIKNKIKNNNLTVIRADKSNSVVILNIFDYTNKVEKNNFKETIKSI